MNQTTAAAVLDRRSVIHSTFSVERTYPFPPASVFFAFADQATKRRWFADGDGWEVFEFTLDFRVDGTEVSRFAFKGGPEVRNDTQFQNIVPDQRIVFSYRMTMGPKIPKILSACLATVELMPSDNGTLVTYTEQGAYFDGVDQAKGHEEGCRQLLERLALELQGAL
jgi:uncharacterized protein YndB with AHSA1/START domain